MKTISKAGFGLLKFVQAVLGYCDVFKEVKPKKEKVKFLEEELDHQVKTLNRLNADINNLEETLNELNQRYSIALKEKALLQEMLDQAERRLVMKNNIIYKIV